MPRPLKSQKAVAIHVSWLLSDSLKQMLKKIKRELGQRIS